ncbi:RNA-directed DNA polymerase [Dyadobacter subterraneus]|uniref:RNA-directed DNA polymerase n=1 Tax=Dyadobacter subterraneus TaxID=2773304 RepID=A0ABR9WLC1_9BACT|nr:RNA-directed DNA polymerase [Dyadobacter subterraneus]MBE9466318.1 RNA-directed DNA polymerase [Dyadobacter subterraneus]
MKIEDLLAKGYFPRELPPPFNTVDFASKYGELKPRLEGCITKEPTRCIDFSVAKVGLVRKTIKIPNPIHQTRLCETIVENWGEIELIYKLSKFSFSRPKQTGTRASNPGKFKNFMRKVFLESYPYSYELKTDISKYYPSIYTHSIPWAIHGKAVSKANKGSRSLLGNRIDSEVSNTMYGQTVGIPMGPDTSHIISEIIGCKIDERIASEFPNLKGYRYVDDMYFFFHSEAEAEDALLKLQQTLKEFELQINAEKTSIRKIPRGIEPDWIIQLRSFDFRNTEIKQNNDIISFFSQAFDLAIRLPRTLCFRTPLKELNAWLYCQIRISLSWKLCF